MSRQTKIRTAAQALGSIYQHHINELLIGSDNDSIYRWVFFAKNRHMDDVIRMMERKKVIQTMEAEKGTLVSLVKFMDWEQTNEAYKITEDMLAAVHNPALREKLLKSMEQDLKDKIVKIKEITS